MKKTTTYCDVCKKEEPKQVSHWTQSWGRFSISFSHSGIQGSNREYDDCCPDCGKKIRDAVLDVVRKLEAENNSPLSDALK